MASVLSEHRRILEPEVEHTLPRQPLAWCHSYGVPRGRDSQHMSIDAVLKEANEQTMGAINRLLPHDADEFLSLAVSPQERGDVHGVMTAMRLHRALLEPIRSILDRGGKCWRSYVIAACCTAVGGDFHEHLDWLALPEVMHVGSLIVDDVEDASTVRRGGPSCHALFGPALAIDAGSFAYFALQSLMERYRGSDATRAAIYREYVALLRAGHAGQSLDLLGTAEVDALPGFAFYHFLFAAILAFDGLYISLVWQTRHDRERAGLRDPRDPTGATFTRNLKDVMTGGKFNTLHTGLDQS